MRVRVIGTGLIGTSVGLAATAAGCDVTLEDRDREFLTTAVELGAGRSAHGDDPGADLVVVAVPPSATAAVVRDALARFPRATVTDVASVKSPIMSQLGSTGASRYVPGHPMAGRELSGPAAATADLFIGRLWLLTPSPSVDPRRVDTVADFVASTGAVARLMPPDVHDRAVALTSHVPQVVASLMAARLVAAEKDELSVAGQGLRDVVRIANSEPDLWADILTANAAEVLPVLGELHGDLVRVVAGLRAGERTSAEAVRDLLMAGNLGTALLPAKHGGAPALYDDVRVEVDDTPGALGRLFLAAGEADINLEDVRIEHTLGRLTAIAHLSVDPDHVADLRAVLSEGGWRILR